MANKLNKFEIINQGTIEGTNTGKSTIEATAFVENYNDDGTAIENDTKQITVNNIVAWCKKYVLRIETDPGVKKITINCTSDQPGNNVNTIVIDRNADEKNKISPDYYDANNNSLAINNEDTDYLFDTDLKENDNVYSKLYGDTTKDSDGNIISVANQDTYKTIVDTIPVFYDDKITLTFYLKDGYTQDADNSTDGIVFENSTNTATVNFTITNNKYVTFKTIPNADKKYILKVNYYNTTNAKTAKTYVTQDISCIHSVICPDKDNTQDFSNYEDNTPEDVTTTKTAKLEVNTYYDDIITAKFTTDDWHCLTEAANASAEEKTEIKYINRINNSNSLMSDNTVTHNIYSKPKEFTTHVYTNFSSVKDDIGVDCTHNFTQTFYADDNAALWYNAPSISLTSDDNEFTMYYKSTPVLVSNTNEKFEDSNNTLYIDSGRLSLKVYTNKEIQNITSNTERSRLAFDDKNMYYSVYAVPNKFDAIIGLYGNENAFNKYLKADSSILFDTKSNTIKKFDALVSDSSILSVLSDRHFEYDLNSEMQAYTYYSNSAVTQSIHYYDTISFTFDKLNDAYDYIVYYGTSSNKSPKQQSESFKLNLINNTIKIVAVPNLQTINIEYTDDVTGISALISEITRTIANGNLINIINKYNSGVTFGLKKNNQNTYNRTRAVSATTDNITNNSITVTSDDNVEFTKQSLKNQTVEVYTGNKSEIETNTNRSANLTESAIITNIIKDTNVYATYHNNIIAENKTVFNYLGNAGLTSINVLVQRNADDNHTGYYYGLQNRTAEGLYILKSTSDMSDISVTTDIYNNDLLNISATLSNDNNHVLAIVKYDANGRVIDNTLETVVGPLNDSGSITKSATNLNITNYYYVLEARPREFNGVILMSWAIGANAALAVNIHDYVTFNSITRTCGSSEPEEFTTKQDIIISDDHGYNGKHAYMKIEHLYYGDILEIDYSLKDTANYSIKMCDVTGQTAVDSSSISYYIVSNQFTQNVYFTNVNYHGYDFIKYCVVKPKKYNLTINANIDYFNIKSVVINHGSELWANWFALEYTAEAASKTFDIPSSITHNNISETTTYTDEVFYEDTIIIELQPAAWCSFRDGMQSELTGDSKERLQITYNTKTKEFTVKSNVVIDSITNVMTISDTYTDITAEMSNYLTVTDNSIDSTDLSSIVFNLIPGNVIYRNKYYVGLCKPDTVMATRIAIAKSNTITYNNNTITPVCASSSITRNNASIYTLTDSDANNPTELTQLIQYIEYCDKLTASISNATGNAPLITNSITDLGSFSRDDNLWYKYITADNGITLQSEVTLNGTAVPQILIKPNITAENLYTTTVYFNGGSVYDTPSDPILSYFEATVEYTNAYTINILGRGHDYLYHNIDTDDDADKFPSEILLAYIADSSDSNKKTTTMLYKFTNIYKDYSKIKITDANTHDDYLDSDGEDIINNQYNVIPVTITHNDSDNTNTINFDGTDADLYLFEYHIKRDELILPALGKTDSDYSCDKNIPSGIVGHGMSISTGISNVEYTILDGYEASEVKSECYIVGDSNSISNNATILDNKISLSVSGYSTDIYQNVQQSIHVYDADQPALTDASTTVNHRSVTSAKYIVANLSGSIAVVVQNSKVLLIYNYARINDILESKNLEAFKYQMIPFVLDINDGDYFVTNRITLNQLTSDIGKFDPSTDDYYYSADLTRYLNYCAEDSLNYNYIKKEYKSGAKVCGLLNSDGYCNAIELADLSKLKNYTSDLCYYSGNNIVDNIEYDNNIKLLEMSSEYLIVTIDGDILLEIMKRNDLYNSNYSGNILTLEINGSPLNIGLSELKELYYDTNSDSLISKTSLFYSNSFRLINLTGDVDTEYSPYSCEFYKLKYDYEDDDFTADSSSISGNSLEKDSAGNTNIYDAYYEDASGDIKYDIYFNSNDSTLGDDPTVTSDDNEYQTQYVLLIMPLNTSEDFSFSGLTLDTINTVGVDNSAVYTMRAKTAATVKFDVNNTIKTYNVTTSGISISYNEYYYIEKILSSLTTSTIDTVNLTSKTTKYEISVNKVTISTNDTSTDACYTTASINNMNLHTLYIPVSSTLSATYTLNDTYAIINPTSLPGTSDITVFDINNKQTTVKISDYYKTEYSNKDRGITGTNIVYCSRALDAANNKYMFKPAAIRYYYTNFIGRIYDASFNASDINWSFSTNDRKTWVSTITSNNDAIVSADRHGLSYYSGSPMYVANIYCYKYSNGKIYIKVGDKLFVSCSLNGSDGYFCVPSLISYSYEFTNDAVKGTTLTNVPYIGMQITSSAQLGSNLGTSIIDANNRSIVANFIAKPDDSSAPCYFASTITNDSVDSYTLGFVDNTDKFYLGSDVYTESDKKYYWTYAALTMSTTYVTSLSGYCKYYVTTNKNDSNIKGYKIVHDSNSALFNAALLEYNTESDDTSDYFARLVNIQFHTVGNNYIRPSSITNSGGYYLLHGSNSSISNLTNYDNVSRLGIEYDNSDAAKQKNNIYHRDNIRLAQVFNKYMSNHVAILSMMYFGNEDAYSQCLYNIGADDNGGIAYVNSYTKTLCTIYRPKSEIVSINYIIDDYDYSSSVLKTTEIEED